MDPSVKLALMFGLGLFVQAVFLINKNFKENFLRFLKALAPCLAITIIFLISVALDNSGKDITDDVYVLFFWTYLVFIISFITLFFYKALYEINEKILLVWTLIFWYAYAVNVDPMNWLSVIFLIPTFVVLLAGFAPAHMDYFWKAFLYGWFLFILVFLIFIQFKSSGLDLLGPKKITPVYGLLTAFSAGMLFLSVMLYGSHLLAFLPIAGKHQRWSERAREIREHAINLSTKYSNYQMAFKEALIIFLLIGGIFLGNYYFKIVSNDLIINLGIIGSFLYSERPGWPK